MRGERSSFPIRDMQRENAAKGSGEVKTYKMSPEELEDYRAKNGYKAPTNASGVAEKRGMDLRTKPKLDVTKTEQPESDTMGHIVKEGPDKEFVLTRIAAGKSISSIERELAMKVNALHYWIRKWDWVGITPGKARAILSGEPIEEVIKLEEVKPENIEPMPTAAVEILAGYKDRIAQLEAQNSEVVATSGKAIEKLMLEIADLVKLDNERQLFICKLNKNLDFFHAEASRFEQERNQALQAVSELEDEKLLLLQTIDATVENAVESVFVETVNHPDNYSAGGIEVIDFIVAKLTADEFSGFCKGNILKYASRANHKGGFEDVRKVKWYVDRLIEEVDAK